MNNELVHHGIDGQKWGNRRFQNPDGSLTPLGRLRYGVGKERKATIDVKSNALQNKLSKTERDVHELSDAELRSRLNRLQMETQYSSLVARMEASSSSSAKKLALKACRKLGEMTFNYVMDRTFDKVFKRGINQIERTPAAIVAWYTNR